MQISRMNLRDPVTPSQAIEYSSFSVRRQSAMFHVSIKVTDPSIGTLRDKKLYFNGVMLVPIIVVVLAAGGKNSTERWDVYQ